MLKRVLVLFFIIFLVGCGPLDRKINAKDLASWGASIQSIRADLKGDNLDQFDKAVEHFANQTAGVLMANVFSSILGNKNTPTSTPLLSMESLDGKTGRELIALALQQRRDGARGKMNELKNQLIGAKAAGGTLAKIQIDPVDIRTNSSNMFMVKVVLELNVTNGTERAIKTIYMRGQVVTEGREVPWIDESLNYSFPGGLEKGEKQHLIIEPNMFMDNGWANPEIAKRRDVKLLLQPANIEWADGTKLIEASRFGEIMTVAALEKKITKLEEQASASRL